MRKTDCRFWKQKQKPNFFLKIIRAYFLIYIFYTTPCFAVLSVFDSSTYGLTSQLLSSFREALHETKIMGNEIEVMQHILGKGEVFSFSKLVGMFQKKNRFLKSFSKTHLFSQKEGEGLDFLSYRHLLDKEWLGSFNKEGYMKASYQERIANLRATHFKESILNGLAFVSHQKEALKQASVDLASIFQEAEQGTTLRSDGATANKLLSFLAYEMIQTRAVLLQILEMQNMKEGLNLPIVLGMQNIKREESL